MKLHTYAAEALGAFILALLVRTSLDVPALPTLVVAGLTLGTMVYVLGPVSGAHFNPAVTLGLASIRKISWKTAGAYVAAQLLGGVLAYYAGNALALTGMPLTEEALTLHVGEAMGAVVLLLGVASVVYNKTPKEASGIVIGASLTLGALVASLHSGGVLNPAVALAVGAWSVPYFIAPLVGGVLGAWAYRALVSKV